MGLRGCQPVSPMLRWLEKVSFGTGDKCWIWLAAKDPNGYGRFGVQGSRTVLAHRFVWEALNGPVPAGLVIRHQCDTPACVRPDHLLVGTYADNMQDMKIRRRSGHLKKTACPHGHPYDDTNTRWYQGRRYCRECLRLSNASQQARRRDERSGVRAEAGT